MPEWSETNPLRVVTGYHNIARKFFSEQGFEHVVLLSADGALEAAPLMGTADIILDLVRGGTGLCQSPPLGLLLGVALPIAQSISSASSLTDGNNLYPCQC